MCGKRSLKLPKYRKANDDHKRLVKLSKECHRLSRTESDGLADRESEIDQVARTLWDITSAEMSKAFG